MRLEIGVQRALRDVERAIAFAAALDKRKALRFWRERLHGAPPELAEGEEPVDQADLMAALTLIPHVRAEVDALEAGLLQVARGRGMTWQAIAFGLGLGSAQAARQRYERLTVRTGTGD